MVSSPKRGATALRPSRPTTLAAPTYSMSAAPGTGGLSTSNQKWLTHRTLNAALRSFADHRWSLHQRSTHQEKCRADPCENLESGPPAETLREHRRQRGSYQCSAANAADGNTQSDVPPKLEPLPDRCNRGNVDAGNGGSDISTVGQEYNREVVGVGGEQLSTSHQHCARGNHRPR